MGIKRPREGLCRKCSKLFSSTFCAQVAWEFTSLSRSLAAGRGHEPAGPVAGGAVARDAALRLPLRRRGVSEADRVAAGGLPPPLALPGLPGALPAGKGHVVDEYFKFD